MVSHCFATVSSLGIVIAVARTGEGLTGSSAANEVYAGEGEEGFLLGLKSVLSMVAEGWGGCGLFG